MNSVRAELIVSGLVQGVGFRYYCFRTATQLKLNGWVKNNPDGTVTTSVEGDRSLIEEYLSQIRVGPISSNVSGVSVSWKTFIGEHKNFEIVR